MNLLSALDFNKMSKKRIQDITQQILEKDGGEGSGNFGHKGRPGQVGGSGSGGGSGKGSGVGNVERSTCSKEAMKTLKGIGKKIAKLKNEQSFIIGQNGEILASSKGDHHSVGMTVGTYREHMDGNIGVHNHPGGGTFSPDDLRTFGYGATEIHVFGPDGHYMLRDKLDPVRDKDKIRDIYNYGWLAMQRAYLEEVPQEMSYGDLKKQAEKSENVVKLDKKASEIADKWLEMRKNGASDEELKKFYDESGYEDLIKERKQALQDEVRRLEVEPAHEWFKKNAEKYGFEYQHKKNFKADSGTQKQHKDAIDKLSGKDYDDGTYSLSSMKPVEHDKGFQVTFCQIGDDYSEEEYAKKVNEFIDASDDGECYAGKYEGTPEISFHVSSREEAERLARKYNQISIWDWEKGEPIFTDGTGRRD